MRNVRKPLAPVSHNRLAEHNYCAIIKTSMPCHKKWIIRNAENALRIFPHFHVDFSLPMWPLLSKPLCISMGRQKMYFLVHKVIRNRSIWGPC